MKYISNNNNNNNNKLYYIQIFKEKHSININKQQEIQEIQYTRIK